MKTIVECPNCHKMITANLSVCPKCGGLTGSPVSGETDEKNGPTAAVEEQNDPMITAAPVAAEAVTGGKKKNKASAKREKRAYAPAKQAKGSDKPAKTEKTKTTLKNNKKYAVAEKSGATQGVFKTAPSPSAKVAGSKRTAGNGGISGASKASAQETVGNGRKRWGPFNFIYNICLALYRFICNVLDSLHRAINRFWGLDGSEHVRGLDLFFRIVLIVVLICIPVLIIALLRKTLEPLTAIGLLVACVVVIIVLSLIISAREKHNAPDD